MPRDKRNRFDEAASLTRLAAVGSNAAEAATICRELAAAQHAATEQPGEGEGYAERAAIAGLYRQLAKLYDVRARRTAATLKLLRGMQS
jgi:hypothetical protein